ncbi:MAG: hypothetical protein JNM17_13155 [Archangium sp.]|nr:hypothetical protein [Archangium sp.]
MNDTDTDFWKPAVEFFEAGKVISQRVARTVVLCAAVGTGDAQIAVEFEDADLSSTQIDPSAFVYSYEPVTTMTVAERTNTFFDDESDTDDPFSDGALSKAWDNAVRLMNQRGQDVDQLLKNASLAAQLGTADSTDPVDDEAEMTEAELA